MIYQGRQREQEFSQILQLIETIEKTELFTEEVRPET